MKLTSLIAGHIRDVYEGDNWTAVTIAETIGDLTFEEAIAVTPASANSIAAILYHVKFYNDVVKQRLGGINPYINDANGFDMAELKNQDDWKKLKEDARQSFINLATATENFPEERLNETSPTGTSSYYYNLHGIAEHAHYHLGQMVLLKKLIRK